jgi:hypothetical protein
VSGTITGRPSGLWLGLFLHGSPPSIGNVRGDWLPVWLLTFCLNMRSPDSPDWTECQSEGMKAAVTSEPDLQPPTIRLIPPDGKRLQSEANRAGLRDLWRKGCSGADMLTGRRRAAQRMATTGGARVSGERGSREHDDGDTT